MFFYFGDHTLTIGPKTDNFGTSRFFDLFAPPLEAVLGPFFWSKKTEQRPNKGHLHRTLVLEKPKTPTESIGKPPEAHNIEVSAVPKKVVKTES